MTRASLDSTTPEELGRLFLEDVARAALSFTSQRSDFVATLDHVANAGVLDDALRQSALSAAQLTITEARATFWLEPVEVSWWRKLLSVFGLKPPGPWRLATPRTGLRYEVVVAPSPRVLELSAQLTGDGQLPSVITVDPRPAPGGAP